MLNELSSMRYVLVQGAFQPGSLVQVLSFGCYTATLTFLLKAKAFRVPSLVDFIEQTGQAYNCCFDLTSSS